MAYILGQDEEQQQQQQQSNAAPLVGAGTGQVAGAATGGSGGVGKGGQGGWTNLQSYLGANTGNTGGSAILDKNVSSQFGQEKEKLTSDANKYVTDAQKQVDDTKVSNEQADEALNAASGSYDWGGQHKAGYGETVDKMKGALNGAYSGPTSYQYSFGADTQNYGNSLKDDSSFNKFMGDQYAKAAGSPLSTGQRALQNQLDVSNDDLQNTRTRLLNDYSSLGDLRDSTVKDTTDKLSGVEQSYRLNQNNLRDYLTGKANALDTSINDQEGKARSEYANLLNSGSGREAIGYSQIMNGRGNQPDIMPRSAAGIWGNNLTWSQLQKENDTLKSSYSATNPYWYGAQPELDARRGALNDFYAAQDAKYANVADEDERKYNALQDFLSGTTKKEQGFKIR